MGWLKGDGKGDGGVLPQLRGGRVLGQNLLVVPRQAPEEPERHGEGAMVPLRCDRLA